jgi:hypothetical protein
MSPSARCDTCTEPKFLPNPTQIAYLHEILRSNSLPPETTHFRHVVETAPVEIARYDSEIERLQIVLEKLVADRATLRAYADGCRSIDAPIRQLPPEVLVQIFHLVPPVASDVLYDDSATYDSELGRLAKEELLALSNVCSHWHGIVMNTPMLWSTIVTDTELWEAPETMVYLLSQSLKRGGNHPLTIKLGAFWAEEYDRKALELLAQHSQRWRDVYFVVAEECMGFLSQARGNLPALENLDITAEEHWTEALDVFAVAPRLTKVKFTGSPGSVPNLPWTQLQSFTCTQKHETDFRDYLYLARRLSGAAEFQLDASSALLPIDIQSTVSEVQMFELGIRVAEDREHAKQVLGGIFGCLTLPYIQHLFLEHRRSSPPLSWSHAEFLSLASRSSFHDILTTLSLVQVLITEDEVLECLSVLPLLRQLELQDYHRPGALGIPDHAVITDKLLHALSSTHTADCLVPHLLNLRFSSLLRFSDNIFLAFVKSRLILGRSSLDPFRCNLWWIPGHKRTLDCIVPLSELVLRRELKFSFKEHSDYL